ncbi:MAG: hypothetical protein ACR2QA_01345 [Solirubrobacteraceae bacterium]
MNELHVLVAREAEAYEPLPRQRPREILQQLDPPLVDLDALVEGGKHRGNPTLRLLVGEREWQAAYDVGV